MNYLLDTCVISELVTRQPEVRVVQWVDSIEEERLFLSAITIGEIKKGIEKLAASRRKEHLVAWLERDLLLRFQGRILPVDVGVMLVWGALVAELEQQGKSMPAMDSLIAAIALEGGFGLVTRNEQDFASSGVRMVNPWR